MKLGSVLLAVAVAAAQNPPKGGSIEGTVVDSTTRAPVAKAKVSFVPERGRSRLAVTDETGKFHVANVEPGSYSVEYVEAPGFRYESRQRFPVAESLDLTGIVIGLLPLGAISGKVLNEDGDPVEGAQVAIMEYRYSNGVRTLGTADGAVTDDRGLYRVFHLRPGRYFVNAWLPPGQIHNGVLQSDWMPPGTHRATPESGYMPVFYPSASDMAQASAVQLAPGGDLSGIDFRLRPVPVFHIRGKLTGAVTADKETSVLAGPCPAPDGAAEYGAKVEADGRFDIAGVSAGVYCLALAQAGFNRTLYIDERVTVTDKNIDGFTARGLSTFSVSGALRIEGPPVELEDVGIMFLPIASPGSNPIVARVDALKFTLEGGIPGKYQIRVNRLPASVYVKSIRYGERDVSDGVVTLTPAGDALTIVLGSDPGRLSISVQLEGGAGADNTAVTVESADGRAGVAGLHVVLTDRAGRARVEGLPPGDYTVYAWDVQDIRTVESADFRREFSSRAANTTVGAGATATVQLKAIPAADIRKVGSRY
jgi:hypothetical protein